MEPADILHLLRKKRLSYADLDRKFGLSRGSALHASRKPHEPGEQALSDVLGMPAHRIWPSRYDPQTGERLKPQPAPTISPSAPFVTVKKHRRVDRMQKERRHEPSDFPQQSFALRVYPQKHGDKWSWRNGPRRHDHPFQTVRSRLLSAFV
ncbi:transcriptional regulator [uncultured Cohaesibacter sp.]|uniref:helix-turn-helix domain-containing protein n=1 Tax=uncultured Cohaesibacter sp. TaxID=1002546 RepID=UPI003748ED6A